MKITDRFGNPIEQGDTLAWLLPGYSCLASVQKLVLPGTVAIKNGDDAPGKLVLQVTLQLVDLKTNKEGAAVFDSFIKSFDPRETERLLEVVPSLRSNALTEAKARQ